MIDLKETDMTMDDLNPYKENAILFDLDGVILDSETVYTEIWNEIDRLFPTGVPEFALKIKGSTLEKILDDYYPSPEIRNKVEAKLYDLESQMHYLFKPGSEEALKYLKNQKIPIALVTSSNSVKMQHVYDQIDGFKDFFDVIITGDMVSRSKPDPEGYALAASLLKKKPENCIVVEDSYQGIMAGKNLNARVVGVKGTIPIEKLSEGADFIIDSLAEFINTPLLRQCFSPSDSI